MVLKANKVVSGVLSFGLIAVLSCSSRRNEKTELTHNKEVKESMEDTWPLSFGYGRSALQAEIDSLSGAIPPSGVGLPPGQGLALRGKMIYQQKCAACHGMTGKEGPQDVLVATASIFSEGERVSKAIGNYWPYPTTVFDYIRRAMPLNAPGSLSDQEVYDLTAWLLFQNDLIAVDFVVDTRSLPEINMPAQKYFVLDTRTGGTVPVY